MLNFMMDAIGALVATEFYLPATVCPMARPSQGHFPHQRYSVSRMIELPGLGSGFLLKDKNTDWRYHHREAKFLYLSTTLSEAKTPVVWLRLLKKCCIKVTY